MIHYQFKAGPAVDASLRTTVRVTLDIELGTDDVELAKETVEKLVRIKNADHGRSLNGVRIIHETIVGTINPSSPGSLP